MCVALGSRYVQAVSVAALLIWRSAGLGPLVSAVAPAVPGDPEEGRLDLNWVSLGNRRMGQSATTGLAGASILSAARLIIFVSVQTSAQTPGLS